MIMTVMHTSPCGGHLAQKDSLCDHVSHVPEQQLPTGQIPVTAHLNVGHEVKQISYQDLCFLLEFLKAL